MSKKKRFPPEQKKGGTISGLDPLSFVFFFLPRSTSGIVCRGWHAPPPPTSPTTLFVRRHRDGGFDPDDDPGGGGG